MNETSYRHRVAIIGSGSGSNARALCVHAQETEALYSVELIVTNKPNAGIVGVAGEFGIPVIVCVEQSTFDSDICSALDARRIEIVLLAGFMRHVSDAIIAHVGGNILNIHPSLLPRHGGHGMYGIHVHRAVLASGDNVTGATVHIVTSEYDQGRIIDREMIVLHGNDTAEHLQDRVKLIEHTLYPRAVDKFCRENSRSSLTVKTDVKSSF